MGISTKSTRDKINEHTKEALEMSGSERRYSGVVQGYDRAGTTIFIRSGERTFLAFRDVKNPLNPGDQVTFRIDGMRAKEILKDEPSQLVEKVVQEVWEALPQPPVEQLQEVEVIAEEPEVENSTSMAQAFHRLFRK
jgi:hypothetical protein